MPTSIDARSSAGDLQPRPAQRGFGLTYLIPGPRLEGKVLISRWNRGRLVWTTTRSRVCAFWFEDEYLLADELKHLLKAHGAETVRLSGSLHDAFAQIRAEGFEIALIDINLRGDAAFPVADDLLRRRIPFAFITGYARDGLPPRFREVPYWQKPIDSRSLVANVARLWKSAGPIGPA